MDAVPYENELTFETHRENDTVDEFHQYYGEAVERVRGELGASHPLWIDGESVDADDHFSVTNPGDHDETIGEFAAGTPAAVDRAVEAAADAFQQWRTASVAERTEVFRAAVAELRTRKFELAATVSLENGKNRTEAMADVDEAIDFLQFYSRELERNDGYEFDTGEPTPGQHCTNVLRPYGVFGVVAPFNFPLAILAGMTTGPVIAGNTAVVKPASATPLIAHKFVEALTEAGLPDGVVNLVTGSGSAVGQPLVEHDDVAGVVFTGSREVGRAIERTFRELGKRGPVVAELGGKNPVIVTADADLEKAVSGVAMGAFSFSGQKCSATSRVYVHEDVIEQFTADLVAYAESLTIGPAEAAETVVSPVVDGSAVERYTDICEQAAAVGTVRTGGELVDDPDLPDGHYLRPTVVTDVPHEHALAREEHFLPFVTIHPVADLEEGLERANDSDYGLCAGLFSETEAEIETWLDRIESGMCYVNRAQSATTGALVQAQPFGGWKASGTTGKFAGGYWYLPQFVREQSRTRVTPARE
ncbi:aldehyde dehydrogenase family protein [Halobellus sp. Atlit-31R]|nr:aldehyde dehydrogenase family protein [Halobellus sp. Atlit-31R]